MPQTIAGSKISRTFAVLLRNRVPESTKRRDVVQLVVYLVWDQGVARSSRVIPTTEGSVISIKHRDVVQLVVYLVWDQGVARSSRVIPTNKGRLAQLVQSICLTSRGSAVRIRQRPQ